MMRLILMAAIAVCLGCGGPAGDAAADREAAIAEPMQENLEKARDVEDQVRDNKDRIDAALEAADDGT